MKIETVWPLLIFPREYHIELENEEFESVDRRLQDLGWKRDKTVEVEPLSIYLFGYSKGKLKIYADWDNWTGFRLVVKKKIFSDIKGIFCP